MVLKSLYRAGEVEERWPQRPFPTPLSEGQDRAAGWYSGSPRQGQGTVSFFLELLELPFRKPLKSHVVSLTSPFYHVGEITQQSLLWHLPAPSSSHPCQGSTVVSSRKLRTSLPRSWIQLSDLNWWVCFKRPAKLSVVSADPQNHETQIDGCFQLLNFRMSCYIVVDGDVSAWL